MKQNNPPQFTFLRRAGGGVLERGLLEMGCAHQRSHFGPGQNLDAGVGVDAFDQISRHGLGEVVPPDGDEHLAAFWDM